MDKYQEAFEAAWVVMFNIMNNAWLANPKIYEQAKEWREKYKDLWEKKDRRMK